MDQPAYLPPANTTPLRVLAVPGALLQQYDPTATLGRAIETIDPAVVVAVKPNAALAAQQLTRVVDRPVCAPQRGVRYDVVHVDRQDSLLVVVPDPGQLPPSPGALDCDLTAVEQLYVLSTAGELRVSPHRRETTVDGMDTYTERLPAAWQTGDAVTIYHLSTGLRAGFETRVSGPGATQDLPVVGVGTAPSQLGAAVDTTRQDLALTRLHANGVITAEAIAPDRFGVRGIEGIGEARAQALQRAGITTVEAAAELTPTELAHQLDVGSTTAERIVTAAEARANGRIIRTSGESLPSADPIYVDIETDGLSGATAWLVGVLDGTAADGTYYPFRQQSPADPSGHLEAFGTWLAGQPQRRPVVAWNGYGFDFDILTQQFREHCPDLAAVWDRRRTIDPLYWARDQDNAVLPGRSNALEHVARALGWEPTTTGIDGELAATVYTRWRDRMAETAQPQAVPQPDWERLEAYCEDDVRALATIYEALEAAPIEQESTQGTLADFGE